MGESTILDFLLFAVKHGAPVSLSPMQVEALDREIARLTRERDEARLQGAREERAAVVAWFQHLRYGGRTGHMLQRVATSLQRGEHLPKRTRPTEPPPVVVVRREVVDE